MTLFPIVARELRVLSRRSLTFRIRNLGALAAVGLGAFFLLASSLPGGLAPTGQGLFWGLSGLAFVVALLSGVVLTADCLSRERREGTLGFLFLTDLLGSDVVFGKLAALALVPLYGLLSVFPVVAMSVFLGGVTSGELVRVVLVVISTMMLSLSVGMAASAAVDDDRRAVVGTVTTLAFWCVVPEALAAAIGSFPTLGMWSAIAVVSPSGVLRFGAEIHYSAAPAVFWTGIVGQCLASLGLLALASRRVRRLWRESPVVLGVSHRTSTRWRPAFWVRIVERQRSRMRRHGVIAWRAWHGSRLQSAVGWVVTVTSLVGIVLFGAFVAISDGDAGFKSVVFVAAGLWVLKVLLAVHTVYSLNDLMRNGGLEELLMTPISSRALWDGHMAAARAVFLWPAITLGLVQLVIVFAGRLMDASGGWFTAGLSVVWGVLPTFLTLSVHAFDFLAIAYGAARWTLTCDRPGKALFRTVTIVILLPGLFCSYGRFVVDLLVVASAAADVERFRELARAWFTPTPPKARRIPPAISAPPTITPAG